MGRRRVNDKPTKKEFDAARAWRLARGLSVDQLAELTGYARETIYVYERGGHQNQPIQPWVWLRYKSSCAGVEAELQGSKFEWQT
jgi:DNA-binding XRE family transcriptional regulator